jgi:hypothetical protein
MSWQVQARLHIRALRWTAHALCLGWACAALAQGEPYQLALDVQQVDKTFVTQASFVLPLKPCQAWQYLTDYDAALQIPGIVASSTTRLGDRTARVRRTMKDAILFVPIRMYTVIDFSEIEGAGTDFVQVEGEARSHKGSWRLQPHDGGTLFRYRAVSEPDSSLPMAVVRYFVQNRLQSSFAAMARHGATRRDIACS